MDLRIFPSIAFVGSWSSWRKLSVLSKLRHFSIDIFLSITTTLLPLSCLRTIMLLFLDNFSTIFRNLYSTRIWLYLSRIFLSFVFKWHFIIWNIIYIYIAISTLKIELKFSLNNIFLLVLVGIWWSSPKAKALYSSSVRD